MGEWERSMLALSGAEYEIQETLQTMRRLLAARSVRSTTRVVLEGAAMALENELALQSERASAARP
jgi:hypothetical protein